MEFIYSLDEISNAAAFILAQNPPKIIIINGEMGAGKTTLIKNICIKLGVEDETSSPTFSIVNEYSANEKSIFHFDFYRLKNISEAYDMGLDEYLYSGNICLIEWPEIISELLPENFALVDIKILADGRRKLDYTTVSSR